jgi:hypothetical protein
MRAVFVIIMLIGVSFHSCDTSPNLVNCDFDEKAMLTHYADQLIVPRLADLRISLVLMESSIQQFGESPSIGLLNEARIYFGAAYKQYQMCSPFAFGPGLIDGVAFRERFNTFPANVNGIEANIQTASPASTALKSEVGFPAIDYLLFGQIGTSDNDLLALYTTDGNAANRLAYLEAVAGELKATATQIEAEWSSYRPQFINNIGTADGTSIGMVVNEFNYDFETLKNFKFKIPLGKFNGGVVLPAQVEAYYAGGSVELASTQAETFKALFEGTGYNGSDGPGLYEYLVCLEAQGNSGQLLADEISDQFDVIIDAIEAIPNPMSETLTNDKPVVDNAYLQMQMMVPKIKYEMTTALGVQINYQDNDGD